MKPGELFESRLSLQMAYLSGGPDDPQPGALERAPLDRLELPLVRDEALIENLRALAQVRMQKELRRQVRRQLRDEYERRPAMQYELFDRRLAMLQAFQRDLNQYDTFRTTVESNASEGVFLTRVERGRDDDIPLFAVGPLSITDSGSLRLDMGSFVSLARDERPEVRVAEDERRPWVSGKDYSVSTDVRLSIDPFRAVTSGDVLATVRGCGVAFEVSWLSDVLGREFISAEIEAKSDLSGDHKAFVNIIVKSR